MVPGYFWPQVLSLATLMNKFEETPRIPDFGNFQRLKMDS